MSLSDRELHPDESVSQVMVLDITDDESNVNSNPMLPSNSQPPVPHQFKPRVTGVSKALSAYFMITADTENEGRRFLRVSI